MRVVVDTNVFVSALLSPTGRPAEILELILTRRSTLLLSLLILAEYQDVLIRKKLSLQKKAVEDFFQFIKAYAENIPEILPKVSLPDPDDLAFLACALEGKADFLITGNKKHFPAAACEPAKIVSPAEFLEIYRKETGGLQQNYVI